MLSVIIVSYNVRYYVEQCLRSVFASKGDFDVEAIVIDNASHDETIPYLKERFPQSRYPHLHQMAHPENAGFGRANNLALQQASGDYVLFLNPDTLVTENTFADCIQFFRTHSDAGAVGVRMLKPNGEFAPESRRGLPTPFTSFCKLSGLSRCFPYSPLFGRYYMHYLDSREVCAIDVVSGAFMMMPREVAQLTEGFDESFFMYGEDIDLSYRIQKAGYQNYYLPTPILHYKGESTEKTSYRYVYVFYEAMLIFFNKHYRHLGLLVSLPIKLTICLLGFFTFLQQQMRKLRQPRRKLPGRPIQADFLFIGSSSMLEQARLMAERFGWTAVYYEGNERTLPQGHLAQSVKNHCRFVAYDMESYSVSAVLRIFDGSSQKDSFIATYYPSQKQLITNIKVYQL